MNPNTEEERKQYHWYQNAQNLFWKSPIWEVDLGYDEAWNNALLDEIYDIGRNITLGIDKNPSNSIWDYSHKYPHLNEINKKILDVITTTITKEIPEIRMLNIKGVEHFMGWINVREPGERLEVHGHTESAIAATYYVKAKEGCGDIVLFDTAGAIDFERNMLTGSPYVRERRFKPVEGRLIFFPNYVLHGVDENKSDDLRISLTSDVRKVVDPNASNTVILKTWAGRMSKIKDWKPDVQ